MWSINIVEKKVTLFFLICVCIAGIDDTYSTKKKSILFIQAIPAIVSIITLMLL
ncbi:DUF1304 family protein [Polaribacter glomeratus]|nr:DUF1304 family protein [Polaribacter glomeratus]